MKTVTDRDGVVEYHPGFLNHEEAKHYFKSLTTEIEWQHDQVVMFGRHITTKRKVAWYANGYYEYVYSNNKKFAKPWTKTLLEIKHRLEHYSGEEYNACLLNYYHNGSEGMGWHSDDEVMMKKHATIASISLGAKRPFLFRHTRSLDKHSIELDDGSLLLMKGKIQEHWKHQLPIRKRIDAPRINLTFRHLFTT
jgi:alkylated DNA repair dioxygenase AlkB